MKLPFLNPYQKIFEEFEGFSDQNFNNTVLFFYFFDDPWTNELSDSEQRETCFC